MTALLAPESSAASRLCTACGLCCNGVMFHTVRLQPGDSSQALVALGLKLKRKKGHNHLLQPCPAFQNMQCSIYAARPERCRLFECRQLERMVSGKISEAQALEKIHEARRRVDELNDLLQQSGHTNPKRPLSKRCEKILAEPIHPSSEPTAMELRHRLTQAMAELNTLLNEDFRLVPSRALTTEEDESDKTDASTG